MHVGEAFKLFSALYSNPWDTGNLLGRMGLEEKRNTQISKLSGGQKQRLFIALALINRPKLVFLDELTTGLDPQARRSMWDLVNEIRESGCTVFLTTHFMEEAERLCDRVAILDHGSLIALDTPSALIQSLTQDKRLSFQYRNGKTAANLDRIPGVTKIEFDGGKVTVFGAGDRFVSRVVSALEDQKIDFRDLRTEQPSLEDVFIHVTGRKMRD
jgi:ABC-2 type transport system ATP-binding protein